MGLLHRVAIAVLAVALLAVSGCARRELTPADISHLDSLDATGVVQAYFSSGDPQVELHLSSPAERRTRSTANYVAEDERVGGVEDLRVSGGEAADREVPDSAGFTDVRRFIVEYVSKRASSTGGPPGRRHLFVYTGKEAQSDRVRVLGVGTGP